jgi:hypothetical protein
MSERFAQIDEQGHHYLGYWYVYRQEQGPKGDQNYYLHRDGSWGPCRSHSEVFFISEMEARIIMNESGKKTYLEIEL